MQNQVSFTLSIILIALYLSFASFGVYANPKGADHQQSPATSEWQKLLNKREFDRIINTANAILQIDSSNQDALFYQGMAYYKSEREDLSVPFFINLINQHQSQTNQISHYRLALSHFYLHNSQQAIELLNKILADKNPPHNAQLILAYALAKDSQFEEAANEFDRLLAYRPTYSLYYNRALVYWELNQLSKTIQDLKSAVALNADFQLPYYDLISIYVMQDETQKAYQWLESLLKKRDANLSRFHQDPVLTDFIKSAEYQALLTKYNMN